MFHDASWADAPDPIPNDPDPDRAPAAPDAGALLADLGLSSRAVREALGHPAGTGPDG